MKIFKIVMHFVNMNYQYINNINSKTNFNFQKGNVYFHDTFELVDSKHSKKYKICMLLFKSIGENRLNIHPKI